MAANSGADGRYLPSGLLVYAREGVLLAAPLDLEQLEVTGPPVAVGGVLQQNYGTNIGSAQFRVSQSGTLVYISPVVRQEEARTLVWVDRTTGREDPLPIPSGKYYGPRISPEGRRLVFYEMERDVDVWMFDARNNALTRVTTEGRNGQPSWSPDGTRIVYRSAITGPDNIFWRAANRTDVPERPGYQSLVTRWQRRSPRRPGADCSRGFWRSLQWGCVRDPCAPRRERIATAFD